jgi:hypothetical protein
VGDQVIKLANITEKVKKKIEEERKEKTWEI